MHLYTLYARVVLSHCHIEDHAVMYIHNINILIPYYKKWFVIYTTQ